MPTFVHLSVLSPSGLLNLTDLDRVVGFLRQGALAILPTETGPMLAAIATDEAAVRAAFRAKGRADQAVMHIACSSLAMAREYADIGPATCAVLGQFTPGPLTVVTAQTATAQIRLPQGLVTHQGTVGIRVPDHPATMQVIAALGVPLTATSVNRSGQDPAAVGPAELADLDWPASTVTIVEDGQARRFDQPSTLVKMVGGGMEILRPGPITADAIAKVLAQHE